jgi:hypothetical protein
MDRRLFLLAALTLALYWPTLVYGYVYEDWNDLTSFSRPWPTQTDTPVMDALRMPTRKVSAVSWAISGTDPQGAHAGNVVLHLANGLLVYAVGLPWVGASGAVMAAGVFWLHPVQVESVAYISSRPDLVAGLFTLLAAWAWKSPWWSLLAAVLAVFAKETFVMVLLIPFVAAWREGRHRVVWAVLLASVPMGLFGVWAFGRWPDVLVSLQTLGQVSRLLLLWVWPVNQTIDHDWALLTQPVLALVVFGWMALSALAWLHWDIRRLCDRSWRWPVWVMALGAVLVFFLPRFVVPLSEGLHEHHLYAPSLVLSLWVGWMLRKDTACVAS